MRKKYKITFFILLFLGAVLLLILFLNSNSIAVLEPKGLIGLKQRDLITIATLLMLIVVIPVFVLAFVFAWKYRASNTKAKYDPDFDRHRFAEYLWWGLPCAIIAVLAVVTWKGCHELDPYKPLDSSVKPMRIQVVALDWKWLFIYPEQNIACVNFFQFPEQTPIHFEITSDAPMNSFWIPQLGGQIFAMSGMKTELHLIANEAGNYRGSSANISGRGFSGMTFTAKASSHAEFEQWVESVKQSASSLNMKEYKKLAEPSEYNPVAAYVLRKRSLFDWISDEIHDARDVICLEN